MILARSASNEKSEVKALSSGRAVLAEALEPTFLLESSLGSGLDLSRERSGERDRSLSGPSPLSELSCIGTGALWRLFTLGVEPLLVTGTGP